jgi:hypothetical protein
MAQTKIQLKKHFQLRIVPPLPFKHIPFNPHRLDAPRIIRLRAVHQVAVQSKNLLLGGYAALMLKFVLRFWTPRCRANPRHCTFRHSPEPLPPRQTCHGS